MSVVRSLKRNGKGYYLINLMLSYSLPFAFRQRTSSSYLLPFNLLCLNNLLSYQYIQLFMSFSFRRNSR